MNMDVESLAKVVFRYLSENLASYPDYKEILNPPSNLYISVENLKKHLFPDEQYDHFFDYVKLLEVVTLLERQGLVMRSTIRSSGGMNQFDFAVYLTSIGIKSKIDEDVILLVDKPEEIVRVLEQKVGNLDPVVRQYYLESLRAYQERSYNSSVICLGVASERSIHWLAESVESHSQQYQGKLKANRNMRALIKYLSDTVIPDIFSADKNVANELKKQLKGLGDVYRKNRNEAGHPQTVDQRWSREDQAFLLMQFSGYITTICEAIGRLN